MDQLFVELIGKPQLHSAKIITIVADNFSLLDDQAKFLKATLAIPAVKQLPLDSVNKRLVQIGPLHCEVEDLLENKDKNWIINKYAGGPRVCDQIIEDLSSDSACKNRSLIFINDASKFLMCTKGDNQSQKKLLRMIDSWKRSHNHFVVVLFQQSTPTPEGTFLRDLEYISDASVHCKSYKSCYLQSIWFQPIPPLKTLIPPKVETHYYTCKIGKSYWSADLLCFYERNRVSKNHDPDSNDMNVKDATKGDKESTTGEVSPQKALEKITLESDDEDDQDSASKTLPYIRAQNPEQSRIFYYPDKDDDIDEDDPDNDLDF